MIWGTELSIHVDCSSSKGEPLGDYPSLGRKERQDCGSHRLGLWSQIQARPAGGGVESQDPGRNKTPAGVGPGQLVIPSVCMYATHTCVRTCVGGSELQSHCFEPTEAPPEKERQLFSFFSCVKKKKKKKVPVPPSPPLGQNGEQAAKEGGREEGPCKTLPRSVLGMTTV